MERKQSIRISVQAILLFTVSIFIIGFGDIKDIPLIKTFGYMTAGLSGTVFFRYWLDGKKENIFSNWKSCLYVVIIAVVLAIPITLLFEGKLW